VRIVRKPFMIPERIVEDQENERFVALVRKIDGYLLQSQARELFGHQVASLERLPNGCLFIQKELGNGLRIRGVLEADGQTVTLRISLDPPRFRAWVDALGPVELFYMDPYGIEVYFKGSWQISLNKQALPLSDVGEPYELARIEVKEIQGKRRLLRVK
jgi:hypothetical protein